MIVPGSRPAQAWVGTQLQEAPQLSRSVKMNGFHVAGQTAQQAVPISLLTDSYKAAHYLQYPDCKKMVAVSSPLGPSTELKAAEELAVTVSDLMAG